MLTNKWTSFILFMRPHIQYKIMNNRNSNVKEHLIWLRCDVYVSISLLMFILIIIIINFAPNYIKNYNLKI